MSERLGMEDLLSPSLQQEADRIDAELSTLNARIQQLENLAPDLEAAEEWLQKSSSTQLDIPAKFVQKQYDEPSGVAAPVWCNDRSHQIQV